jgi:hypothetical protein
MKVHFPRGNPLAYCGQRIKEFKHMTVGDLQKEFFNSPKGLRCGRCETLLRKTGFDLDKHLHNKDDNGLSSF